METVTPNINWRPALPEESRAILDFEKREFARRKKIALCGWVITALILLGVVAIIHSDMNAHDRPEPPKDYSDPYSVKITVEIFTARQDGDQDKVDALQQSLEEERVARWESYQKDLLKYEQVDRRENLLKSLPYYIGFQLAGVLPWLLYYFGCRIGYKDWIRGDFYLMSCKCAGKLEQYYRWLLPIDIKESTFQLEDGSLLPDVSVSGRFIRSCGIGDVVVLAAKDPKYALPQKFYLHDSLFPPPDPIPESAGGGNQEAI